MVARFSTRHARMRFVMAFVMPLVMAPVALAALGIVRPAVAQTAAQPSPAAMLLAKQLVDIKNVKAAFQPLVRGVVIKTRDLFLQSNFMWSKDLNEVSAIVEKQYEPRVSEVVDATARIYATHFTEQELKDMVAFYQSPVGRKMIVEEPKVLDESMANAGSWGDNLSQEVMASMRAEMKKRGKDM
jgi:hypothetical protein